MGTEPFSALYNILTGSKNIWMWWSSRRYAIIESKRETMKQEAGEDGRQEKYSLPKAERNR